MTDNDFTQTPATSTIFALETNAGRARDHNEDAVDAFKPADPQQQQQKGELYIVADGMGGHHAGEVASALAVKTVSQVYYNAPEPDTSAALRRAIEQASAHIYQQAQQVTGRSGMGTTIVAAVIRGQELTLANVGDSRAYLMRDGVVKQVTQDHSFVAEQMRAGVLTPDEARTHPKRNVVTRALGSKPEVRVDTYHHEWRPGDSLLLCSDGLSEYVQEEDMRALLSQYSPEHAVPRLVGMANERGGADNISAIVVHAAPPAAGLPAARAARNTAAPGTARAAQASSATRTAPARSLPLPLIAGLAALAGVVLLALLAALFVWPGYLRPDGDPIEAGSAGASTQAPPPSPTPTVATPTAAPTTATATPEAAAVQPSSTPRLFALNKPEFRGTTVTFTWSWYGKLPSNPNFRVTSADGVLCETQGIQRCEASILELPQGDYRWWVELWDGDQLLDKSDVAASVISIIWPPTETPVPATDTPAPATDTPEPPENTPAPSQPTDPPETKPPTKPPVPTTPKPIVP